MADDADKIELVQKLNALAKRTNGGKDPTRDTWEKLFAKYDRDKDQRISAGELATLLEDADVGNWLTRSAWVDNIVYEVDHQRGDKDGTLSLAELMNVVNKLAGPGGFLEGGVRRVNDVLQDFVPTMPSVSVDGTMVVLGLGLLYLLSKR